MLRACFLPAVALASLGAPAGSVAAPQGSGAESLVGTWSFDGRTRCKTGPAWIFSADGSYSEVMLPDRRPRAKGRWRERGVTIFYSLAVPGELPGRAAPLNKRMKIVERSPDRLVAIGGRRVRHVMHRCEEGSR